MKPFDNAGYQIHEWLWRSTADKNGFIVVAPVLMSPHLLGEFPMRNPDHWDLKGDGEAVARIINEVANDYAVNRDYILLTSWSSGGYVLHYLFNRYPDLFFAAVARESNFHPALLDEKTLSRYRHKPIFVYYGQNDFPGVKREVIESAKWYRAHGFRKIKEAKIRSLGHQRRPDIAAEFFIESMKPALSDVKIVASPVFGKAPMITTLAAEVPEHLGAISSYLWLFGVGREPIGNTQKIAKFIPQPGEYPVEVVVTVGGRPYSSKTILTVERPEIAEADAEDHR
jgi:predicted esterase